MAEIARTAHEIGLHSNATMLYGHVETLEERVDHLVRLREAKTRRTDSSRLFPWSFIRITPRFRIFPKPTGYRRSADHRRLAADAR